MCDTFRLGEAARLQTFPDAFVFHGSWTETMRQLGNAVPVRLASAVTNSVGEALRNAERSTRGGSERVSP